MQPDLVQEFIDDTMPMGYSYLNTSSLGRTRVRRERESIKIGNPPLSDLFEVGARGEAALLLLIMSDDTGPITADNTDSCKAPKQRVQSWLVNERFPTDQGFTRPTRQIQLSESTFLAQGIAKWQAWMQDSTSPQGQTAQNTDGRSDNEGRGVNQYFVDEAFAIH